MKKYHKDYKTEKVQSSDGKEDEKILYEGDYYTFSIDAKEKKRVFISFLLADSLYILFFILSGLLNNDGSRSIFIVVPYVFLFLPIVYLTMGTFSFLNIKEKMERVTYDKALGRMDRSSIGILCISLYLCIADGIFIVLNRTQIALGRENAFLCINIIMLVCIYIQNKYLQKMKKRVMIIRRENGVPTEK